MPEQQHPPYSPNAKTVPRLLNRWLDINSQNGPLTRTRTYIKLPTFSINVNYEGYDDIVAEYLFASPNNLCLKLDISSLPPFPNYTLCVMWIEDGKVNRYRLWDALNPNILFDIPLYSGENIGKFFKLEVWSSNVATIKQDAEITIYTSVLNDLDYRYGTDTELATNFGLCQGQQTQIDGSGSLPLPFIFGSCTYTYSETAAPVILQNEIQQIITNENNTPISIG